MILKLLFFFNLKKTLFWISTFENVLFVIEEYFLSSLFRSFYKNNKQKKRKKSSLDTLLYIGRMFEHCKSDKSLMFAKTKKSCRFTPFWKSSFIEEWMSVNGLIHSWILHLFYSNSAFCEI